MLIIIKENHRTEANDLRLLGSPPDLVRRLSLAMAGTLYSIRFFFPADKKALRRGLRQSGDYFLIGLRTERPPMNLRRGSGMITEPSACWNCSRIAGKTREVARPDPLSVWQN